jgi:serine/threonine-protein kinase
MGEVYKARDCRMERVVALKLMRTGLGADENQRKRFLREARAIAAFSYSGIAGMHDAGEAEDCLFLAMEYVCGHTLEQEIANGSYCRPDRKEVLNPSSHGPGACACSRHPAP